jgi:hypothetical protein
MRALLTLVVFSLLLFGCSVRITTERETRENQVCGPPDAGGYLAANGLSGLGLRIGAKVHPVIWPYAWSARRDLIGPLVLVGREGRDVAREGDLVGLSGGFDEDDTFHACDDPHLELIERRRGLGIWATYA